MSRQGTVLAASFSKSYQKCLDEAFYGIVRKLRKMQVQKRVLATQAAANKIITTLFDWLLVFAELMRVFPRLLA